MEGLDYNKVVDELIYMASHKRPYEISCKQVIFWFECIVRGNNDKRRGV